MVRGISQIKRAVDEYRDELERHNIRVSSIMLHGSYANGKPKRHSDVDLVVVSKDLKKFKPLRRQEILSELTMNIEAPLEVIGYTPEELQLGRNTVFGQIIKGKGIKIYPT